MALLKAKSITNLIQNIISLSRSEAVLLSRLLWCRSHFHVQHFSGRNDSRILLPWRQRKEWFGSDLVLHHLFLMVWEGCCLERRRQQRILDNHYNSTEPWVGNQKLCSNLEYFLTLRRRTMLAVWHDDYRPTNEVVWWFVKLPPRPNLIYTWTVHL